MVLSRVLGEQWMYGFVGGTWSHTLAWPAAVQNLAWFGLAWNLVHVNDNADEQRVFHTQHPVMLYVGALIGYVFVWAFRTPQLLQTNFVRWPWRVLLLLSIYIGSVGGYLLVSLLFQPLGTPFPLEDESTGIALIASLLGVALIAFGVLARKIIIDQGNDGKTFFKYLLNIPLLIFTTEFLANRWFVTIFAVLAIYVALYLWAVFVWADEDTKFSGPTRRTKLLRFYGWLYALHIIAFLITNFTDHCFAGAPATVFDPSCDVNEAVAIVFYALLIYSGVVLLFLSVLAYNRWQRTRRRDNRGQQCTTIAETRRRRPLVGKQYQ